MRYHPRRRLFTIAEPSPRAKLIGLIVFGAVWAMFLLWVATL